MGVGVAGEAAEVWLCRDVEGKRDMGIGSSAYALSLTSCCVDESVIVDEMLPIEGVLWCVCALFRLTDLADISSRVAEYGTAYSSPKGLLGLSVDAEKVLFGYRAATRSFCFLLRRRK